MLVLTRKLKEEIRIGDQITISVLRIKGNHVRLGIEAPRDVRVVRGELELDVELQEAPSSGRDVSRPASEERCSDTPRPSAAPPAPKAGPLHSWIEAAAAVT